MDPITIATLVAVALFGALFAVVRKIISNNVELPLDSQWIVELSFDRYRPMLRMLDVTELKALRSQPGYSPKLEADLRAQRCQVFRGYLRSLETDFRRVCTAAKLLLLQSELDRPDLASILMRQQASFAMGMAIVNVRLAFYRWGISGVDVSSLLKRLDAVSIELRSLAPSAIGA